MSNDHSRPTAVAAAAAASNLVAPTSPRVEDAEADSSWQSVGDLEGEQPKQQSIDPPSATASSDHATVVAKAMKDRVAPVAVAEEEHKRASGDVSINKAARLPPCIRCDQDATSFCASCGGDLCNEHDSAAHSAADGAAASTSHARVMQADKAALLQAMAEGSDSAFHKSAESCKASVQGVLRTLD